MKRIRKLLLTAFVFMFISASVALSEDKYIAAGGATIDPESSPNVSASFIYAKETSQDNWLGTLVDVTYKSLTPQLTLGTAVTPVYARRVTNIGDVPIFTVGGVGAMMGGDNLGYSLTGGLIASIRVKKSNWRIMPNFRILKSSIAPNRYIGGVMMGFGNK